MGRLLTDFHNLDLRFNEFSWQLNTTDMIKALFKFQKIHLSPYRWFPFDEPLYLLATNVIKFIYPWIHFVTFLLSPSPTSPQLGMASLNIANDSRCLKFSCWMCLHVLLVLFLSSTATSGSILDTLPGYYGKLPFKLETGWVCTFLFTNFMKHIFCLCFFSSNFPMLYIKSKM